MKNYYLEQIRLNEKQIALAKVGFMQSVKNSAERLKNATEQEAIEIIKDLVANEKAYTAMKEVLKYNQEQYENAVESKGGQV